MNEITKVIIAALRDKLEKASDEERLEIFEAVSNGYCNHCGNTEILSKCQCNNDE